MLRLNPFSKMAGREIIAVDFCSNYLKVMHCRAALHKCEIIDIISRQISNLSDDDIAKIIKTVLFGLNAKDAYVINIVPAHLAITKNIEIPSCDSSEIREIISLQAGRHTPYSRDEIIVEYSNLGAFKNSYTKILLVIVAKNIIKRYYDVAAKANLRLDKISFAPEAMALSLLEVLRLGSDNIPVGVIDVDEGFSDFVIIFKNRPLFVRGIPIGFQHLNSEHKQVYKTKFIEEVKKSFDAYQGEGLEKSVNILVMTGSAQCVKDLEEPLSQTLGLAVRIAPYFNNLAVSAKIQKNSFEAGVSFFNLVSCAFSWDKLTIDLTLEDIKLRKSIEQRARQLIKTGIFILANFVLVFLILISRIYFKAAYLKKIGREFASISQEAKMLEADYSKISLIRNSLLNRGYSLESLARIYDIIPDDVAFNDVRLDEQGRFYLSGTAKTMSVVFSFAGDMEKSNYFKDVKTKHTTKRKEGKDEVADFEIAATLEKSG